MAAYPEFAQMTRHISLSVIDLSRRQRVRAAAMQDVARQSRITAAAMCDEADRMRETARVAMVEMHRQLMRVALLQDLTHT